MPYVELTDDILSLLEMALDDNSYESEWYFDRETNKVTFISDEGDPELEKELRRLIEEDTEGERFIYISPLTSSENWQEMEDFILEQDGLDDTVQSLLLTTIRGRGAFQRFQDAIDDAGLREDWYTYKNRLDRKKALRWLKEHELISDEGVAKGLKMLDDMVARLKRIEDAKRRMTKGARVICSETIGHSDKITPGKIYDIIDERPDDLLIRIKDDRGKVVWLPKSHFDLA